MIISPSEAISKIENDRKILNKRYEQLRVATEGMIELGYTEEEFLKEHTISVNRNTEIRRWYSSLTNEERGGQYVSECLDLISVLKTFKNGKRKPNENTIKSVSATLLDKYCWTSYALPEEVLERIDEDKKEANQKLDELKHICKTLCNYGITSRDYHNARYKYTTRDYGVKNMVNFAYNNKISEALDIANYIESSGLKPYKSWFGRVFCKRKMDETLQAMLNRLLELYVKITQI